MSEASISRRRIMYGQLSDLAHDLFLEIYGSYDNFLITERPHPLEDYIISYDENMEDDGILIALGERIGFGLDYDETGAYTPPEQFYDRCSYTIRNNTPVNISKIINMTDKDFELYVKEKGLKYNIYMYYDRLNIDSHKYNKELIDQYVDYYNSVQEKVNENSLSRLSFVDEGVINDTLEVITPDNALTEIKGNEDESKISEHEIKRKEYEDKYEDEVMDVDKLRYQIIEPEKPEDMEMLAYDDTDDRIESVDLQDEYFDDKVRQLDEEL